MRKLVVVLVVAGVAMLTTISTAFANPAPRVMVCKYVGKPGVHERLKGGKNPIEVSANSLPGYVDGTTPQPGDEFADAQERSVVVADGTTTCPAPIVPYRIVVRMVGTGGGPYRERLHAPSDAKVTEHAHVTCPADGDKRIAAYFDGSIGAKDWSVGPFASRHGPVLRIYSEGTVLVKDRASAYC